MRRLGPSTDAAIVLAALALLASACSGTQPTASAPHPASTSEDCFLGLDLWDTDPALTWIEDGRVWVRAGDHQACLAVTDAVDIWWSPDGRRLFLDEQLVEKDSVLVSPDFAEAQQVVWEQPLGESLFTVEQGGDLTRFDLPTAAIDATAVAGNVLMLASHPDAAHVATIDGHGLARITSLDSGASATVLTLDPAEQVVQIEFSADGSLLWILANNAGRSTARYVDLAPVSAFLDIPEVESMVPSSVPEQPTPDLYYLDTDLSSDALDLEIGIGATGTVGTGFVLHPTHPDWVVLAEGSCSDATSSLFIDGVLKTEGIPGTAVGFFRGGGIPILATFTGGGECGTGELWVISGLPLQNTPELVAEGVSGADVREEAPDPWNPNTAPPFA